MKYIYFVSFSYTIDDKIRYGNIEVPFSDEVNSIKSIDKVESYIENEVFKNTGINIDNTVVLNYQLLRTEK